jgi:arsenical pump membrane protein
MLAIFTIGLLLFLYFKKDLLERISTAPLKWSGSSSSFRYTNPFDQKDQQINIDWKLFKLSMVIVILGKRI